MSSTAPGHLGPPADERRGDALPARPSCCEVVVHQRRVDGSDLHETSAHSGVLCRCSAQPVSSEAVSVTCAADATDGEVAAGSRTSGSSGSPRTATPSGARRGRPIICAASRDPGVPSGVNHRRAVDLQVGAGVPERVGESASLRTGVQCPATGSSDAVHDGAGRDDERDRSEQPGVVRALLAGQQHVGQRRHAHGPEAADEHRVGEGQPSGRSSRTRTGRRRRSRIRAASASPSPRIRATAPRAARGRAGRTAAGPGSG